jgi:hypothetical protein
MTKPEPWYVHAGLYLAIAVLTIILVKVAILDPQEAVVEDKYYRAESRLRMQNLKEAEILWSKKHGSFTANLDSLINFIKNDPMVDSVMNSYDSLSRKPANPFVSLSHGEFNPDSLKRTPKSQREYVLAIDTTTTVDTVVSAKNKIVRIDSSVVIGSLYYIEDPDGYGTVGSKDNLALKNTASWE